MSGRIRNIFLDNGGCLNFSTISPEAVYFRLECGGHTSTFNLSRAQVGLLVDPLQLWLEENRGLHWSNQATDGTER